MSPELHVLRLHGHAGDALMAAPVLRAFRRAHPEDRVYLLADEAHHCLFRGSPDVDMVFPLHSPNRGAGRVVDLADFRAKGWARTRTHIMDHMAAACGVRVEDRSYGFMPPAEANVWSAAEAKKLGRFVAQHVRSSLDSKDWPLASHAALRDELARAGLPTVQVGGAGDPRIPGDLAGDYRGRLSYPETAALLSRAEAFIGPDSACMHLSRAVRDVPCVAVWGSTSPLTSGLFGGAVVNLEPTRRCGHDGRPCYEKCDWSSRCADSVPVSDAARAVLRLTGPRSPRPDLSVILVNWNSWVPYTHKMLHRLEETITEAEWDLVLVDNGSREDGPYLADWTHPRLSEKVLFPENRGLPAAWNEAARRATGRVLAFMNTDVRVEEKGWDRRVLEFFRERPAAGILGLSLNEPPAMFGEAWKKVALPIEPGRETRCHHVNGAAFFVARAAFDRIGGFDERYTPGYCEETDYCLRANLAREEVWHLAAAMRHEGCGVTRRVNRMDIAPVVARNGAYFAAKWAGAALPPLPEPAPARAAEAVAP
jgi:ADP-heptose:LPS heptosyltransferase/GT2 family glycosyltransferase